MQYNGIARVKPVEMAQVQQSERSSATVVRNLWLSGAITVKLYQFPPFAAMLTPSSA
jgi:hypothetical protein